jgi:hypothetical protein
MSQIKKVESSAGEVIITLENEVVIHLNSNPGYLHLSFSGIKYGSEGGVVATPFAHNDRHETLKLANYLDIEYKPAREENGAWKP